MSMFLRMTKYPLSITDLKNDKKKITNLLLFYSNDMKENDRNHILHYLISLQQSFDDYIAFRQYFLSKCIHLNLHTLLHNFKGINFFIFINKQYEELKKWIKSDEIYGYFQYIEAYFEWNYCHIFIPIISTLHDLFKSFFMNEYNCLVKSELYNLVQEINNLDNDTKWFDSLLIFFDLTNYYYIYDYLNIVINYHSKIIYHDKQDYLICFQLITSIIKHETILCRKIIYKYNNLDIIEEILENRFFDNFILYFKYDIEQNISFLLEHPDSYWILFFHYRKLFTPYQFLDLIDNSFKNNIHSSLDIFFRWIILDKIIIEQNKNDWTTISSLTYFQSEVFLKQIVHALLYNPIIINFNMQNIIYYLEHSDLLLFSTIYFEKIRSSIHSHSLHISNHLIDTNKQIFLFLKSKLNCWSYPWDKIIEEFNMSVQLQQFLENDISIIISNHFIPKITYPIDSLPFIIRSKIESVNDIFSIIHINQKLIWDLDSTSVSIDIIWNNNLHSSYTLYIPQFLVFYALWNNSSTTESNLKEYLPFMSTHISDVLESMKCCISRTHLNHFILKTDIDELHLDRICYTFNNKSSNDSLLETIYKYKCQILFFIKKQKITSIEHLSSSFPLVSNIYDILLDLSSKDFILSYDNFSTIHYIS